MIERIARDTATTCVVIAVLFAIWKRDLAGPLGVIGGGVLIALSFWAIRGAVDGLIARRSGAPDGAGEGAKADETGQKSTGFTLVKFFTRHAIVALAAYGMMVRLHLDPMGLLAGVSALGIAVAVEGLRDLRWRRFL
jgi:hypothetical protein